MNTFGRNLRLTTFGESHGKAMGGIIDGFPAGFKIDFDALFLEVSKRKPGSSSLVTPRNEDDLPEFLSGITDDGITLGTPIGFIVRNKDTRSKDYDEMADKFRPNHADYTYIARYGIRDFRGGGRASARETVNWVVAGALALQWLNSQNIHISTALTSVGDVDYRISLKENLIKKPLSIGSIQVPEDLRLAMENEILKARSEGDSIGGAVSSLITGMKAGIGNPVFNKLQATLASAMMSINAAKAFEYGIGTDASSASGIETADLFYRDDDNFIRTYNNYSGGIQGGITNGMPIFFNVSFKPTPTVMKDLSTVDINGEPAIIKGKGRHDPCVALRAVPVVKAMTALVIVDFLL